MSDSHQLEKRKQKEEKTRQDSSDAILDESIGILGVTDITIL